MKTTDFIIKRQIVESHNVEETEVEFEVDAEEDFTLPEFDEQVANEEYTQAIDEANYNPQDQYAAYLVKQLKSGRKTINDLNKHDRLIVRLFLSGGGKEGFYGSKPSTPVKKPVAPQAQKPAAKPKKAGWFKRFFGLEDAEVEALHSQIVEAMARDGQRVTEAAILESMAYAKKLMIEAEERTARNKISETASAGATAAGGVASSITGGKNAGTLFGGSYQQPSNPFKKRKKAVK